MPPKSYTLSGGIFMERKVKYSCEFKLRHVEKVKKNKILIKQQLY